MVHKKIKSALFLRWIKSWYYFVANRMYTISIMIFCTIATYALNTRQTAIRHGLNEIIGHVYSAVSYPYYFAKTSVLKGIDKFFIWHYDLGKINTDNGMKNLKQTLQYSQMMADYNPSYVKLLKLENQQLKKQLNYMDHVDFQYITSRIIMKHANHPSSINGFMLNVGAEDGVKIGCAVVNTYGLVGNVTEVTPNFVTVTVVPDPNLYIPVLFAKAQKEAIVVGGVNNNEKYLVAQYLADSNIIEKVENGEMVVTAGENAIVPYGINVGTVEIINEKILIKPAIDNSNLDIVSVIVPSISQ